MLFNHNQWTCVELNEVWKIQGWFRFNQHLSRCFITNSVTHKEHLKLLKGGRSHFLHLICLQCTWFVWENIVIFVSQIVLKQIINVFNLNEIHVVLYFPTRLRFFICVFGSVTCNDKAQINLCWMITVYICYVSCHLESIYTK